MTAEPFISNGDVAWLPVAGVVAASLVVLAVWERYDPLWAKFKRQRDERGPSKGDEQ